MFCSVEGEMKKQNSSGWLVNEIPTIQDPEKFKIDGVAYAYKIVKNIM
jgi:hypothetical protein